MYLQLSVKNDAHNPDFCAKPPAEQKGVYGFVQVLFQKDKLKSSACTQNHTACKTPLKLQSKV